MDGIRSVINQIASFVQAIPKVPGKIMRAVAGVFQSIGHLFSSQGPAPKTDVPRHVEQEPTEEGPVMRVGTKTLKIPKATESKFEKSLPESLESAAGANKKDKTSATVEKTTKTLDDGSKLEFEGNKLVKKTLKDGSVHEGNFDKEGKLEGQGKITTKKMAWEGTFEKGNLIEGEKRLTTEHGVPRMTWKGKFDSVSGKLNGEGEEHNHHFNRSYKGVFKNDVKEGIFTVTDGNTNVTTQVNYKNGVALEAPHAAPLKPVEKPQAAKIPEETKIVDGDTCTGLFNKEGNFIEGTRTKMNGVVESGTFDPENGQLLDGQLEAFGAIHHYLDGSSVSKEKFLKAQDAKMKPVEDGSKKEFAGDQLIKKTFKNGEIHTGTFDGNHNSIEGTQLKITALITEQGTFDKEGNLITGYRVEEGGRAIKYKDGKLV